MEHIRYVYGSGFIITDNTKKVAMNRLDLVISVIQGEGVIRLLATTNVIIIGTNDIKAPFAILINWRLMVVPSSRVELYAKSRYDMALYVTMVHKKAVTPHSLPVRINAIIYMGILIRLIWNRTRLLPLAATTK